MKSLLRSCILCALRIPSHCIPFAKLNGQITNPLRIGDATVWFAPAANGPGRMAAQAALVFQADTVGTSHRRSKISDEIRGKKAPESAYRAALQELVATVQKSGADHR
jgi:hypothetical protein